MTSAHDPRPPPARPRPAILVTGVLVIVLGVYLSVLDGPFVWDDRKLIVESAVSDASTPLWHWFSGSFWQMGGAAGDLRAFYRPLTSLSYVFDHWLNGNNAAGFHVTNVLIHLINTALLFALIRLRKVRAGVAAALCLVWALLPRLTEDVAWISGRTDVLATLFALIALLLWLESRHWLMRWLSAAALVLGLLSKEIALAALTAIAAYEMAFDVRDVGRWARRLAPLAAAFSSYVALRVYASGTPGWTDSPLGLERRITLVFEALGSYTWMLVDPWQPRLQIGESDLVNPWLVALGACVVVAVLLYAKRLIASLDRIGWMALALLGVSLGLVLQVLPLPMNVVAADRLVYLPALALLWLVSPAIGRVLEGAPLAWIAVAGLVVSLGVATRIRVGDWVDEVRLWDTAVHNSSESNALVRVEFANLYFRVGMYPTALRGYEHAYAKNELPGRDPTPVLDHLANCLSRMGRLERSRQLMNEVLELRPEIPKYHLDLGLLDLQQADFRAAERRFRRALALWPDYLQARKLLDRLPEIEDRFRAFHAHLDSVPLVDKARLFTRMGRLPAATAAWQAVLASGHIEREAGKEALTFLFLFAPPTELRRGVLAYPKAVGAPLSDDMRTAYAERMNRIRRLKALSGPGVVASR